MLTRHSICLFDVPVPLHDPMTSTAHILRLSEIDAVQKVAILSFRLAATLPEDTLHHRILYDFESR